MGTRLRWAFASLAGLCAVAVVVPALILAFSAPAIPPPMASMAGRARLPGADALPPPRLFHARDGGALRYYAYPAARAGQTAVVVHGSAGPGSTMHALAAALRARGMSTYVLDMRGHGGSGRHGDIGYPGQLDDDLSDFVAQLGPARPGERRTLIGFSAGAGFAIRFAGGPQGLLFDRYVFLAPILPGAPTLRPNAGGWTSIAVPRIMTIAWLNRLGIHAFDGLPVIRYAVSPQNVQGTAAYSYRLAANFGAGRQYAGYLQGIRQPAAIFVGSADEQVVAEAFAPLLLQLDLHIPVTVLPGLGHADMISAPAAFEAIGRSLAR